MIASASRRHVSAVALALATCLAGCAPTPAPPAQSPSPGSGAPTPTPVATPPLPADAMLPNLVMQPLDQWHVELRDGRRLLRMSTTFTNVGSGRFEVRGTRAGPAEVAIALYQIVYTAAGVGLHLPTAVEARYAGDGHHHWHAQGVVSLELSPVDAPADIRRGEKVHFCFFDDVPSPARTDPEADRPFYQRDWCGTDTSLFVRMGLSVGWGDRYGWSFAFQWIDITDLPGGIYELQATVDAADEFLESNDTDNCTMSRIAVPGSGEGEIVTVEASGLPCA